MTNQKVDVSRGTNIFAIQRCLTGAAGDVDDASSGESGGGAPGAGGDGDRGGAGVGFVVGNDESESVDLPGHKILSILTMRRLRVELQLHISSYF